MSSSLQNAQGLSGITTNSCFLQAIPHRDFYANLSAVILFIGILTHAFRSFCLYPGFFPHPRCKNVIVGLSLLLELPALSSFPKCIFSLCLLSILLFFYNLSAFFLQVSFFFSHCHYYFHLGKPQFIYSKILKSNLYK